MIALADYKASLRLQHFLTTNSCYEEAYERARRFFERYEQLNRDYCPDDPVYSVERSGVALSTSNDHMTFIVGSTAQVRILEVIIGGEATSSAVNRVSLQRSTGGTTGSGAITPEKFNTRSPAATTVVDTAWTGQPTLSANPWQVLAFNAFGGFIDWKAAPGGEVYMVNSEQHSIRSQSGTSTISSTIVFEEL